MPTKQRRVFCSCGREKKGGAWRCPKCTTVQQIVRKFKLWRNWQ